MERNWRWVSRDIDGGTNEFVDVWQSEQQPERLEEDGCIIFDGPRTGFAAICHAGFLATTGIDIQPGTCVRVEFTAKVLEE